VSLSPDEPEILRQCGRFGGVTHHVSGGGTSILLLAGAGAGGLVVGFLAGLLFMLTRRRVAGPTQPPGGYGTLYPGGGHDARPPSYCGS
jgi:hypothetical protein